MEFEGRHYTDIPEENTMHKNDPVHSPEGMMNSVNNSVSEAAPLHTVMEGYISFREASDEFGISRSQLRRLANEGYIQVYSSLIDRRKSLLSREDVAELVRIHPYNRTDTNV